MARYEEVIKLVAKTKHEKLYEALLTAGKEYVDEIPVSRRGNRKFSKANRGYLKCLDDILDEITLPKLEEK